MSQGAKESIFAWVGVNVFIAMFILTVEQMGERYDHFPSPIFSGFAGIVALTYLAKHLDYRRKRKGNS